ncbi:MAG TPA: HAD-IB family phosphatase [Actinomycetota bacterium]|nr:HAD-IB family phosphatase [Actinomycetota bacterium]
MLPVGSVLVDFDGTACSHDVAEHLLIEFGDPSWPEYDAAWARGEIDTREVVTAQAAMLDAPLQEMIAFALQHCALDPTFGPFVRWLEGLGVPTTLVSDGFGFYIGPLLQAAGMDDVGVVTNTWSPSGQGAIRYGNGHPECVGCGTCKMNAVLAARAGGPVAFVGEGRSDRYAALYADVVFAKDVLVDVARADRVAFLHWDTFDDVRGALETLDELPGPVGGERCPGWRLP